MNTMSHTVPGSGIVEGAFLLPVIVKQDYAKAQRLLTFSKNLVSLQDGHLYRSMCSALNLTINACCKLNEKKLSQTTVLTFCFVLYCLIPP